MKTVSERNRLWVLKKSLNRTVFHLLEMEANQRRDAKTPNNKGNDWSGRADLNCRPLAPQASALPG
jgi:hypothetical protein